MKYLSESGLTYLWGRIKELFATKTEVNSKQDILVSNTNIKTINNISILGNGNITIPKGDPLTYEDLTAAQKEELAQSATEQAYIAAQHLATIQAAIANLDPSQSTYDAIVEEAFIRASADANHNETLIELEGELSNIDERLTSVEKADNFEKDITIIYDVYNISGSQVGTPKYVSCKIKAGNKYIISKASNKDYRFYVVKSYDANKNLVQTFLNISSGTASTGNWDTEIVASNDASYFGITSYGGFPCIITHKEMKLILETEIDNKVENRWKDKKWLLIGDSISTEGGSYASKGYGDFISSSLGLLKTNVAESGKVMSYYYTLIDDYSEKYDLITVMLGTNNQGYNCKIGSLNDEYYQGGQYSSNNSFYAQTQLLIEKLKAKYPKSVIAFITPIKRRQTSGSYDSKGYSVNGLGLTTEAYANVIKDCCDFYCIPCIDIFNTIDPRTDIARQTFFVQADGSDGTHPNMLGHAMFIAPVVEDSIRRIAPYYFNDWTTRYTITNNLTNVTSSSEQEQVVEHEGYTTTLVADEGYVISSVTITMGSVDVTASAYSQGVVNIANVTGNVVITALAEESIVPMYSITNTLSNVTNSNAITQIEEGEEYTATLTASQGYVLDSVQVTMGSTDITSSVYSDGVVSITSVTGDIVITASAEEVKELKHSYVHTTTTDSESRTMLADQTRTYNLYDSSTFTSTQGYANYGREGISKGINVANLGLNGVTDFTIVIRNYVVCRTASIAYNTNQMTIRSSGVKTFETYDQNYYANANGQFQFNYGNGGSASTLYPILKYRSGGSTSTVSFNTVTTSMTTTATIVLTYDKATRTVKAYVNGTLTGESTLPEDLRWRGIGINNAFKTSTYNVGFDAIEFWNKCLTASDVADLQNSQT